MTGECFSSFEEAVHAAEVWLCELRADLGGAEPHQAYQLLCATLHALRDRLQPSDAVQLGAELPALLRGVYYEGWRPAATTRCSRHLRDFLAHVAVRHPARTLANLESGVRAVFTTLHRNLSVAEALALVRVLPEELRTLWPAHVVRAVHREERVAAH